MATKPPREFWREVPCGHPPDPIAWMGDDHAPICHCGCILDGSPLPDDCVDLPPEIEFVIPCGKCGCAVGIPRKATPDLGFRISIAPADPHERRYVEHTEASGRMATESLASDACVIVRLGERIIGWGDDYGTFHLLPSPSSRGLIEEAGGKLLVAAVEFWEVEANA